MEIVQMEIIRVVPVAIPKQSSRCPQNASSLSLSLGGRGSQVIRGPAVPLAEAVSVVTTVWKIIGEAMEVVDPQFGCNPTAPI